MKDISRRTFLSTAGHAALIVGVGGLGAGAALPAFAQDKPFDGQSITHWSFLTPGGKSPREQALAEIESRFKAASGINVTFETFPWQELATKLIAAAQAGAPPDNSRVSIFTFKAVQRADALTNLNDYIEKTFDAAARDDFMVDFNPALMVDDAKWTMQLESVPKALYIRKDWLEEAGLEAPKTWDEFVEVGKALTSGGRWGYVFGASKTQLNQVETIFQPQIHGRGGRILDDAEKGTFNSQEAADTYRFLADCIHTHKITPPDVVGMTYDDVTDAFKSGRAAMILEGSHRYRDIASTLGADKVLLARIPSPDPSKPSPSVDTGWGMGIPRGAANPDASWEYVKFYVSPEAQEINARIAGSMPTRRSVFELPYFQSPEAEYLRWWMEYAAEAGEPIINVATYSQLNEALVDVLHRVALDTSADIPALLEQAVAQYNSMLPN
jgi:multiple sugar transport system substrate-binding protein